MLLPACSTYTIYKSAFVHLLAGSLAIPLALRGAAVSASDISSAMAGEAESRYKDALKKAGNKGPKVAPKFDALDLE